MHARKKPIDRLDPQVLAEACADAMQRDDRATKTLGIAVVRVGPGEAVLTMNVRDEMANGHGICHGGFIFTLADSAFAYACNTYGQRTVAQQCAVTFLQPVRVGARLTAHAVERAKAGRGGIYDVTVRDADNVAVAEFRGHSRTVAGDILAPDNNAPQD
ncbi:acyl-CoA thioesterase [Rhodopseudomonas rhenobacensis]|uniref:Acyl-CoA thioesterase n=1 Tax=Rhodopseudomonas rhenobacensis TaxID=87461 RepID=A0A7W7Z7I6_9BRAD|nr:hydroxyphenylacetyl-CoA thioesterase PaaI [Rhodopseudomonas rhenobacensis]MBB5049303.1 acyl-CoA thioesterase [Rhodopseudomonas rhenobacensis]